jgi:hypothetical protein
LEQGVEMNDFALELVSMLALNGLLVAMIAFL